MLLVMLVTIIVNLLKVFELYILQSLRVNCSNTVCSSSMRLIFSSQKIVETVDLVTFSEEILNGNFIFCAPSVEKHCFVALDVKLQVKVRIKTFH